MRQPVFESAEALRRKFVPNPVRDLLDDLRAALQAAASAEEREALHAAAIDAAAEVVPSGSSDFEALVGEIGGLVDPEPFRVYDDEWVDPDADPTEVAKGRVQRGRMIDHATLYRENDLYRKVADGVANASTALEAHEIVSAALSGDRAVLAAGGGPDQMTWSTAETLLVSQLLDSVVDDGSVAEEEAWQAKDREVSVEVARLEAAEKAAEKAAEAERVDLDAEVAAHEAAQEVPV